VPPQQCPECGRFLKKAFVESLTSTPTPCPRCEAELTVETFGLEEVIPPAPAPASPTPADAQGTTGEPPSPAGVPLAADVPPPPGAVDGPPAAGGVEPSVRPPDLQPGTVRDATGDVLEGWDPDGPAPVVDRAPFPTDLVVMLTSGAAGALLGGLFGERGCRGAFLGGASGVLGAGVARKVWRLS
jgi:hypothetical protein